MELNRSQSRVKKDSLSILVPPPEESIKTVKLHEQLMELNHSVRSDIFAELDAQSIQNMRMLGEGHGGAVFKALHVPSCTLVARKVFYIEYLNLRIEEGQDGQNRVQQEIQNLKSCSSKFIVAFFGIFMDDGELSLVMEYMDLGSLDKIYKQTGPFPEYTIARVASSVLCGIQYLYTNLKILHRDIKPSNILLNSKGEVKLCDFGVSSNSLDDSSSDCFVGTSCYMAPERIMGGTYSLKSEIWSLGLTLMEIALAAFPLATDANREFAIIELLNMIVYEPIPTLPHGAYSDSFRDFLSKCLEKFPDKRSSLTDLMAHEFIETLQNERHREEWLQGIQDKMSKNSFDELNQTLFGPFLQ